jgi:hypothetical protein
VGLLKFCLVLVNLIVFAPGLRNDERAQPHRRRHTWEGALGGGNQHHLGGSTRGQSTPGKQEQDRRVLQPLLLPTVCCSNWKGGPGLNRRDYSAACAKRTSAKTVPHTAERIIRLVLALILTLQTRSFITSQRRFITDVRNRAETPSTGSLVVWREADTL